MITAQDIEAEMDRNRPVLQPHERASDDAEFQAEADTAKAIARQLGIDVDSVNEDTFDQAADRIMPLDKKEIVARSRAAGVELMRDERWLVACWQDLATWLAAAGWI